MPIDVKSPFQIQEEDLTNVRPGNWRTPRNKDTAPVVFVLLVSVPRGHPGTILLRIPP